MQVGLEDGNAESTPRSIKMRKTPAKFNFKGIFYAKKGLFGVGSMRIRFGFIFVNSKKFPLIPPVLEIDDISI